MDFRDARLLHRDALSQQAQAEAHERIGPSGRVGLPMRRVVAIRRSRTYLRQWVAERPSRSRPSRPMVGPAVQALNAGENQ
jgi:hypothetical protein